MIGLIFLLPVFFTAAFWAFMENNDKLALGLLVLFLVTVGLFLAFV